METDNRSILNSLLVAAKAGEQHAFEELLKRYSPLIDSLTGVFALSDPDADDFRQEACIAFYHAIKHFDTDQEKVQFGLYAKTCIRNRLISYARTIKRHEGEVSLSESVESDESADPARTLMEKEDYLALYRHIESVLSSYENRVWWMYLSGRTAREIASIFGRDERSVQNAIYRIRKKLRQSLPPQESRCR